MGKDISHKYCVFCKNNRPFVFPNELFNALVKDELVIFAGAGISTENSNVFPYTFYEDILNEMGYKIKNDISFSKLMSEYCKKTGSKYELIKRIKERIDYISSFSELYSIAVEFHQQLAMIPCITEIVTTNWDCYFEEECYATPFTYEKDMVFWDNTRRKVLKLHGSINNLGSIVATEEDYKERYESLNTGLIGSQLKLLIAKRRIVFVGYSFGDEDFNRIYSLIRSKLGDFMKKPYIVTLDKSKDKKWKELGLLPIYTSGTFFLHNMIKKLEKKGCFIYLNEVTKITKELEKVITLHHKLVDNMDLQQYPEIIFCLSYQDGIIHAFKHFLGHIKRGESLCRDNIRRILFSYEDIKNKKKKKKKWWDVAYIEGYINGHVFVLALDSEKKEFPYYLDLGLNRTFRNEKNYLNSLGIIKGRSTAIKQDAINTVKEKIHHLSIVPQHTPFLL